MSNLIEGEVTRLKQTPKNYFITVLDESYSGYGEAECKVGDKVKFSYLQRGDYKNLSGLKIIDSVVDAKPDTKTASVSIDRTKDIHKQVCLKIAANVISNLNEVNNISSDMIADQIVELADKIQSKAWKE